MTQTILYARVSTADQTLEHQEAQARKAGFQIDEVIADHGVSGVNTMLAERPGGKRLSDRLRRGDVLVVRWLDRLGRNYVDIRDTVRSFMDRGVVVKTVINGMVFDGSVKDPMQQAVRDALLGFMAALGQAQAEATKEAQKAGIAHARATAPESYRGRRPSFSREHLEAVTQMLALGTSISEIAEATGLSRQAIYRIKGDRLAAEAALARWAPQ